MRQSLIARLRGLRSEDRGVTLVEVVVTVGVFSIFLALMTVATTQMFGQQRKHAGIASNLDAGRKIVLRLDKQVRYANAITTPGTGTDGNKYVEWRSGNKGQQQTCTQWRLVPSTKELQYRSWQPILTGVGTVTATGWNTITTGVTEKTGTPIWSITPSTTDATRMQLTVAFNVTNGAPAKTSHTQVALTAMNTESNAPNGVVCNEVARS